MGEPRGSTRRKVKDDVTATTDSLQNRISRPRPTVNPLAILPADKLNNFSDYYAS